MSYVHPKELKIGDIVRFVKKKSWIKPECSDYKDITRALVGQLYEVYKIAETTKTHICEEEGICNPLLRLKSNKHINQLSAWWGSWVLINREVGGYQPEVFGIVEWMRKYDKKI